MLVTNIKESKYYITPWGKIFPFILLGVFVILTFLICLRLFSPVPIMKDYDKLSLHSSSYYIYFSKSSSDISENQEPVLAKIIEEVKACATKSVYLVGHCNPQKKGGYSYRNGDHFLANERAQSVSNYLIDKGIPSYQIYIYENGSLNAGKFRNNDRVEIYFK